MLGVTLLSLGLCGLAASSVSPTVEIAPGVRMPIMNHGDGNQSLWLEIGGRGMSAIHDPTVLAAMGQAVKSSKLPRSDIFAQTGVPCCPSTVHDSCENVRTFDRTEENIDETLKQIGIGPVDLLLMHWPCSTFQETLTAYRIMETAVASGKARAIGVSNFNNTLLAELVKEAKIKPALTQNGYSIGNHRNPALGSDDDTLNYCRKNNITFSAYGPLGSTTHHGTSIFNNSVVKAIAESHNKSAAQIAIRWTVQQGIVPVTSGSNREHMLEDLAVFDFELAEDEMARLEAIRGEEPIVISV